MRKLEKEWHFMTWQKVIWYSNVTCAFEQHLPVAHPPNIGLVILPSCHCQAICGRIQTDTEHRPWTEYLDDFNPSLVVKNGLDSSDRCLPVCLEKVSSLSSCSASASISSSVSQPSSSAFAASSKSTSSRSSAKSSMRDISTKRQWASTNGSFYKAARQMEKID